MIIKYLNNTKDVVAMKLENDGVFVTEDIHNNIFAITKDYSEQCKYTCIIGSTYFIFNEDEIKGLYSAIETLALSNGDRLSGKGETITDGWSFNKYKARSFMQAFGIIADRGLLGDIKLYCCVKKNINSYYLEKCGRRLGGTLNDWYRTVCDLHELKEIYGIWERSM